MFSEQIFTDNLTALDRAQGHRPAFAALDAASTRIVGDPANGPRVEIKTQNGRWAVLDAAASGATVRSGDGQPPAHSCVVLVGVGLGYSLEALETVCPPAKVLAIEPDSGLATLFLARRDWRPWFDSGRLRLLVGPDYLGAATCGGFVDGQADTTVKINPALMAHRPQVAGAARGVAERILADARRNAEARTRFAGRYLLQTLENLRVIQREADASALTDAFRGQPAIVVGAGPSLDRNIADIAPLQDRAVIVAADTTLRPLLHGGIRPYLVVGVDPAEMNARHLSGVTGVDHVHLVAEGSLHPSAFERFAGRTFVFKVSDHEPWPWLRALGLDRGVLRAWGSVITSAFDLALRMGCDPIVFAGLDLAYTANRPYCSHTIFDDQWREWEREKGWSLRQSMDAVIARSQVIQEPDVAGNTTHTSSALIAFRNWLVEQVALTCGRKFVNATGAGILHGAGIAQRSLTDVLRNAPRVPEARVRLRELHAMRQSNLEAPIEGVLEILRSGDRRDALPVLDRWTRFSANTVTPAETILALTRGAAPLLAEFAPHRCQSLLTKVQSRTATALGRELVGRLFVGRNRHAAVAGPEIPTRMLTLPGAARTWIVNTGPRGAVCAGIYANQSFLVLENGAIEPLNEWPRPMIGELPLANGASVAWSPGTATWSDPEAAYFMYRSSSGGSVECQELPFHPIAGVYWQNAIYWSCHRTGLGRWAPGEEPALLVPDVHAHGVRAFADRIRLDPPSHDDRGMPLIARYTTGWCWRPDRALEAVPIDEPGVSLGHARAHGWTATAYPHSAVIRLESEAGVVISLVCPEPGTVAWAGRSLLVASTSGELFLFEGLADAIRPFFNPACGDEPGDAGESA